MVRSNDPVNPQITAQLTGTGVAPGAAPAPPTGLTASVSGLSSIVLSWKDHATNETGFYVERSTNGTQWFRIATVGANVVTYTDNGLARRTLYYYPGPGVQREWSFDVHKYGERHNKVISGFAAAIKLPSLSKK